MQTTSVYVLDACALLAVIKAEDGGQAVNNAYREAENGGAKLVINRVNLLEVYYGLRNDLGVEFADKVLREITESIIEITDLTQESLVEAGRIKSVYKISLADSIAVAETSVSGGVMLTADHHEMDRVERSEPGIRFLWIR
jgi:PIN domain nuclease of toxin-antitoxin system